MKLPELTRMTIEEFESKSNDWFIVKDENYSRFHNYFSWEEMDSYMNSNGLNGHDRFPQLQVIDKKSGRKYCHKKAEQKMTKQDIFKKWKEGSSFVLPLSEHLNKQCWKNIMAEASPTFICQDRRTLDASQPMPILQQIFCFMLGVQFVGTS
jgi:hypothetical protein